MKNFFDFVSGAAKRALLALTALCLGLSPALANGEVNLYTDRQSALIQPILDKFTERTGIAVNVLFAKKGLLERMQAEGENSPVDVVMAVDAGRMQDFADAGLLAPYDDPSLVAGLDASLYTPDWFAVTRRARILYTNNDVNISDYPELATMDKGNGICIRTGFHQYNIGLFSEMIHRYGEVAAEDWLRGVKANLGRTPQGNDRAQIQGVIDGVCDVAIGNSYYYFLMLKNPEKRDAVMEHIKVVVPPQPNVNITGVGLGKYSPNRDNAIALLRFLGDDEAQMLYAEMNNEHPARAGAPFPEHMRIVPIGDAKLSPFWQYRRAASEMVEKVDFDG